MNSENNTSNPLPQFEEPEYEQKKGLSVIWLLPLVAVAIGAWLLYKSLSEAGIEVTIVFDSGDGLKVGKTEVIYKGVPVGKVKNIDISENLQSVTATLEMVRESKPHLTQNTQFWLVKPRVSMSGVSGLETIISGDYIAIRPGKGEPARQFTALPKPPPPLTTTPGLHIVFKADQVGSVGDGSPIYYRQIKVGKVTDHKLGADNQGVLIHAHIDASYAHLIKRNTRFWNASGLTVDAGFSGVKIRTESLAALVAGGIAFETSDNEGPSQNAENGDVFKLHRDFETAETGVLAKIHFDNAHGLKEGETLVKTEGVPIGVVKKLHYGKHYKAVTAEVLFDPHASEFLKKDTRFWLVKPKITAAGISGLSTLLSGSYIGVRPGQGEPHREFTALANEPPLPLDSPGLHITLKSKDLGSLDRESPVLYKKIQIGEVQDYRLTKDGQSVLIAVHIKPEYTHLVKRTSKFWNASGIDVNAGLTQVNVSTGSLATMLSGGIEFATPPSRKVSASQNGDVFSLYDNEELALPNAASTKAARGPGVHLKLTTQNLGSLNRGSPVYYQKIPVGEVTGYELAQDRRTIIVHAFIQQRYANLVKKHSRFWNAGGITVEAGLSGLKVRTQPFTAMLAGGVAFFTPKTQRPDTEVANGDTFDLYEDYDSAKHDSLIFTIGFASGEGLSEGAALKYQGLTVGKVKNIELADDMRGVVVTAALHGPAKKMARAGTRFWVVGPELGLSRTANLDTLVTGRYIQIDPGSGAPTTQFRGLAYTPHVHGARSGLDVVLKTSQLGSIKRGNQVFYRQVPVGHVVDYDLGSDADNVLVYININQRYAPLVRTNSEFWNASGIEVDFGVMDGLKLETESFEALISGGIAFATPDDAAGRAKSGTVFQLHGELEEPWLAWSPKIQLANKDVRVVANR